MSAAGLLSTLVSGYSWLIILRAISSWIQPIPRHPLLVLFVRLTEPVLAPLRRLVPPRALGGLDISPLLAVVVLQALLGVLTGSWGR